MKKSTAFSKIKHNIPLLLTISIYALLLYFFEKNKLILIHFHSWYEIYQLAYNFFQAQLEHGLFDTFFILKKINLECPYLVGTTYGILFSLIGKVEPAFVRIINFLLTSIMLITTTYFFRQNTKNNIRNNLFISLAWIAPFLIENIFQAQCYFYLMFFLYMSFLVDSLNYNFKSFKKSCLSGILLLLAFYSHRISIIYANSLYLFIALNFILAKNKKPFKKHSNFLLFSLFALIPNISFFYYYSQMNFFDPEVITKAGMIQYDNLQEALNDLFQYYCWYIGPAGIAILSLCPIVFLKLLKKSNLRKTIYIITIFSIIPIIITILFSPTMLMQISFFTASIPFIIFLSIQTFLILPNYLKTTILSIKVITIITLLYLSIFNASLSIYLKSIIPKQIFPYFSFLLKSDCNSLITHSNTAGINTLIKRFFFELNQNQSFLSISANDSYTCLRNTLLQTYALKYNKKTRDFYCNNSKKQYKTAFVTVIEPQTKNTQLPENALTKTNSSFLNHFIQKHQKRTILPLDAFNNNLNLVIYEVPLSSADTTILNTPADQISIQSIE